MTQDRLANAFIEDLRAETLASAAVNHPYLRALQNGDFPNVELALKDFAFQYGVYSGKFIRYITALIQTLNSHVHQQLLLDNLAEEQGSSHDVALPPAVLASIHGQPHASLYRRFQDAVGVDAAYRKTAQPCRAGAIWTEQFAQLCDKDECVGVGAVGIGTEVIVSRIYWQILAGLAAHSQLTMTERVFFDLHSQCDDEHGAQMLRIAEDLATDHDACERLAYGARKAIELRIAFWDQMLERAQGFPAATFTANQKLSTLGY